MLRAILFDFNGVLVDDEPLHLELFQRVLGEEGYALEKEDYYAHYLGLDDAGCFSEFLAAAGQTVPPGLLARLIARKAQYYQDTIRRQGYPFFPGASELVTQTAGAGIMLGVVSGALRDEVEGALRQADLRSHFKVLVTAEDVAEGKPHPEGYRRALELLNAQPPLPERLLHPHEVLAIEDSPAGLDAAHAAGLVTLGVAHSYPADRLSSADTIAEHLGEVDLERLQKVFAEASRA